MDYGFRTNIPNSKFCELGLCFQTRLVDLIKLALRCRLDGQLHSWEKMDFSLDYLCGSGTVWSLVFPSNPCLSQHIFKTDLEPIASTPVKHVFIRTRDAMPLFHFGLPSLFEKRTEVLLLVLKVGVWWVSSPRNR